MTIFISLIDHEWLSTKPARVERERLKRAWQMIVRSTVFSTFLSLVPSPPRVEKTQFVWRERSFDSQMRRIDTKTKTRDKFSFYIIKPIWTQNLSHDRKHQESHYGIQDGNQVGIFLRQPGNSNHFGKSLFEIVTPLVVLTLSIKA